MTTFDPKTSRIIAVPIVLKNEGVAGCTTEEFLRRHRVVMKPTCSKEQPAPKGEPIFPGARYAHTARPDWEHPEFDTNISVISGGLYEDPDHPIKDAFRPVEHRQCRHCGGNV
jgi:hypothetical protein